MISSTGDLLSFYKQNLPPEVFAEVLALNEQDQTHVTKPVKSDSAKSETEQKVKHDLVTVAKSALSHMSMASDFRASNAHMNWDFEHQQDKNHVENSRFYMNCGMDLLRTSGNKLEDLTILGCGKLEPLAQLALGFNNCIVSDFEITSLNAIRDAVSKPLRGKIKVIKLDLTHGLCKKFETFAQNMISKFNAGACDESQFIVAYKEELEAAINFSSIKTRIKKIDRQDYVISSLVLSQLSVYIETYVEDIFKKCFPHSAPVNTRKSVLQLIVQFRVILQTCHIWNLRNSVKDNGLVYFADTYARFCKDESVDDYVEKETVVLMNSLFETVKTDEWTWYQPGDIKWTVKAHLLRPKVKAPNEILSEVATGLGTSVSDFPESALAVSPSAD